MEAMMMERSRALTEAHRWRVYSAMLHKLACMAWSRAERIEREQTRQKAHHVTRRAAGAGQV
jgi:hypothetical protein